MVCIGFEPWSAVWKVQMNPLSYMAAPPRTPLKILMLTSRSINCEQFGEFNSFFVRRMIPERLWLKLFFH